MNAPITPELRAALEAAEFVGPLTLGEQYANAQARGDGLEAFRLQGFMLRRKHRQTAWERLPLVARAKLSAAAGSLLWRDRAWSEIPEYGRDRIKSEAWREAQQWLGVFRIGVFG